MDFVGSLGCYDEVVTYDRVTSLPSDSPVALVDMAGNSGLREKLHRQFGDQMKYSGRIGLTHRSSSPDEPELPGAKPKWFFAPDQIRKRAKEWGPGGVDKRFGAAWSDFAERRVPADMDSRGFFNELQEKAAPKREDIRTWFDLLDVDDYVSFGGKA